MNYLFDVDGTLTPPRSKMSNEFKDFFEKWIEGKDVILVTGSDKDKTIEQIGKDLWTKLKVFQSCGNEYYERGKLITKNEHDFSNVKRLLNEILAESKYPSKHGNHIEERVGMINFSTCGRNANQEQRDEYEKWDAKKKERQFYVDTIKRIYRWEYDASVGGQISIDIYPIGKDKSQVAEMIYGPITFFGDKCDKGGNDFSLAMRLKGLAGSKVHKVSGPEQTMKILKKI